jgi:hypothetical protein
MMDYLSDIGFWTLEKQEFIDNLSVELERIKLEMYNSYRTYKGKRVKQLRRVLKRLMDRAGSLFQERHSYDVYTCEGFALNCKLSYLIAATAIDQTGAAIDVSNDGVLLQSLVQSYLACRISESEIRKIARSDSWKVIWGAAKSEGQVFGLPAIRLTDEQKMLLGWSRLYDGIHESPECPEDSVLDDDDLLDGWMIFQHRKREGEKKQASAQKVGVSDRMANKQEIYIPVETDEDAARINQMNDAQARMIKRQRDHMITQRGSVPEQYTPDAQLQLKQKAMQQIRDRMKRG